MASEGDLLAGKYRLERFIGSGGFASVWAARNELIGRPLALKILADTYARKTEIVQRFLREARIACRTIHPVILKVEDVAQTGSGTPFLVMELLEGRSLAAALKGRRTLPVDQALGIVRHVLAGLAAAHAKGIIHRDIKPSNIFLMAEGEPEPPVRVLDLGVAKDLADGEQLTTTGQLVGTPTYLAPEILVGVGEGAWTPAVDVFATGMLLFVMLSGRFPFEEDTSKPSHVRVAERVLFYRNAQALPRLRSVSPEVPAEVDDLVACALALEPGDRFADAAEMLVALEGLSLEPKPASIVPEATSPGPLALAAGAAPLADPLEDAPTAVTPPTASRPPQAAPAPTHEAPPAERPAGEVGTPMGWPTPAEDDDLSGVLRRRRRIWVALGGVAVVSVAALALLGWALWSGPGGEPAEERARAAVAPAPGPAQPALAAGDAAAEAVDAGRGGPAEPEPVTVRLLGLPPGATVTFDGEPAGPEEIEGEAGRRGLLVVSARGYEELRQELTLAEGLEVDLEAALQRASPPPTKAHGARGHGKRPPPRTEEPAGPRHIDGRRPGSKIKVISRPTGTP